MALVNAQTTTDINLAPDAVQLLDVFATLQSNTDVVMGANSPTPTAAPSAASAPASQAPAPAPIADGNLQDLLTNLQSNPDVVMDGNVSTAVTSENQATYNPSSEPTTGFEQEAPYLESEASEQASPEAEQHAYLADVATDLAVQVQAYASEWSEDASAEDEASQSWDNEASWEGEESWEDDETYTDASSYDESEDGSDEEAYEEEAFEYDASYDSDEATQADEASVEQGVYADAHTGSQAGSQSDIQQGASVQGSDRIDLSWLGAKFAHYGMTMDVYSATQVQGQVQAKALDAYAEDSGDTEGYAEVDITGEIDLSQDDNYA